MGMHTCKSQFLHCHILGPNAWDLDPTSSPAACMSRHLPCSNPAHFHAHHMSLAGSPGDHSHGHAYLQEPIPPLPHTGAKCLGPRPHKQPCRMHVTASALLQPSTLPCTPRRCGRRCGVRRSSGHRRSLYTSCVSCLSVLRLS